MSRLTLSLLCALGCAALAACSVETPVPSVKVQEGQLAVATWSVTHLDASYTLGRDSARVEVEYTPTSTRYELSTSLGTTLVHEGTAFMLRDDWRPDVRTDAQGLLVLGPSDAEYALIYGLHQELLALGATAQPTPAQRGSTLYAAGFLTARLLGEIAVESMASGEMDRAEAQRWPYPGYADASVVPDELRVQAQDSSGWLPCCGPLECGGCDWSGSIACDDWCAAGDHCNKYHAGSGCGTAMFFPPGGVNNCPHSNAGAVIAAGTGSPYGNHARNYCHLHGYK